MLQWLLTMRGILTLCVVLSATCLANAEIKNKGWWRNTVFYQVYPRSFMDSDGDGVGDLKGITAKLEHFLDAGIGAIWLSPIYTSPMIDFGYDISDFKDIDSNFGTMEDFEQLTARARQLGIKVILDFVPNHTSDKHEWFQKSLAGIGKYRDYYMWRRGRDNNKSPPNNWISVFSGSMWQYNPQRDLWYLHQFEYRQPDLNYSNPAVRDEMEDVIRFWLRKGVDGFRVDAAPHIYESAQLQDEPRSFVPGATERDCTYLKHIYTKDDPRSYDLIKSWRKVLDDFADYHNQDEKVIMTEAYTSIENTTRFYYSGSHVPFNFKFITDVNITSTAADFKRTIDTWMKFTPKNGSANWVMGNHDNSRTASRYPGRADQMTMLAMILPGVAVTYNGEEIGMVDKTDISWEDTQDPQACNAGKENYNRESRDKNRTPFQWDSNTNAGFSTASRTWLPVNANYRQLNLANQKLATVSHYKIYQALTSLRKTSAALKVGTLNSLVLDNNNVLAVARQAAGQTVVLLINFSDYASKIVSLKGQVQLYSKTTVEISSLNSSVKARTPVDPSRVFIPAKASLVLVSSN